METTDFYCKENKVKKWFGEYRGVSFEINNWINNGQEAWTFYLILHIDRIPLENKPNSFWLKGKKKGKIRGHIYYDYYKHGVICNLEWHGGCTWYSKERGFDGDKKVIKIGCDYSHYWDDGHSYYLESIQDDVRRCIDSFLLSVPKYKYCCVGNGKLYDLCDGEYKNGTFRSNEYFKKTESNEL
jgi:hypothetical protein